ncbi:MAG: heme exporter protein CcmD [Alphaproteobacteria bacterium]
MTSFSDFLNMGGYAAYVWPAFGITAAVLVGLLVQSRLILRSRESTLAELERQREERRAAKEGKAR